MSGEVTTRALYAVAAVAVATTGVFLPYPSHYLGIVLCQHLDALSSTSKIKSLTVGLLYYPHSSTRPCSWPFGLGLIGKLFFTLHRTIGQIKGALMTHRSGIRALQHT
ncbi:hypothetical protein NL676_028965 [Syzygium grande]|nr:hypothetical protein NL676_028965 [Syzygium grande]